ncbi:hypothetical protein ACVWZA_000239 [Sphingomonas sp. UYAg733]
MTVEGPTDSGDRQPIQRNSDRHRDVALAATCEAEAVLLLFEAAHPNDGRPRMAIDAIRNWATGQRELSLAEVRKLSLGSHAAAREASSSAARFAARAAGHAVATWHVPTHAAAVPAYAAKAIAAKDAEITSR